MARALLSRQQNLCLANRALDGANWGVIAGLTRLGGQPDAMGGVQACRLTETAVNNVHSLYNSGSIITFPDLGAQGRWVCLSAYLAPGTRGFGGLFIDGGGSYQAAALWNLNTGANTLLSVSGATEKVQAFVLEPPPPLQNGFRRYGFSFYARSSPPQIFGQVVLSSDGTVLTYLGDVTKNIVAYAPGFAFANWPGELSDTTAAVIPGPIRNLGSLIT